MADHRELVKRQFGAHAGAYATSCVHAKGESLGRLIAMTDPRPEWTVLDVSTGAGHTALAFAPHVARVLATDLTPEMLQTAQALAAERQIRNIEFRVADALALPFDSAGFDLVVSRIALHHYPDAGRAVAEMARVCKPGGRIALVDNVVPVDAATTEYINRFEKLRDPSHRWAYPQVELEQFFLAAGLVLEQRDNTTKTMDFEAWATRMGASEETIATLRRMLLEAPQPVRAFLAPQMGHSHIRFTLTEAILIGRKG
jgi:ubiquinone/menaquinone biosynthesis C-methylase UbiE